MIRLSINILLVLFSTLFSMHGFASDNIPDDNDTGVKGKVVDKSTRIGLEYATVMVYKLPDSAFIVGGITGKDGQFDLKLKPGKYFLSIQFLGYNTVKTDFIEVKKGNLLTDLGSFIIEPDQRMLDQVEVIAEKSTMEMTLDKKVFNIGKDISSKAGNAVEVLENIPSVTVDIDGNVSLRGDDGVRILIDGKVSGMAGINSRDALRSLQADMIDRIEVVTNPSVRYDAEGTSGIINIVLKKDRKQGFNGSVDATLGYPLQYGIGINTNYRLRKFNFFANYAYNYRERIGSGDNYKEIYNEGTYITNQHSARDRNSSGNTIRFGTEYFFNASSSISGSLMYRLSHDKSISTITYYDYNPNSDLVNHSERKEDQAERDPNLEYAINYKKQFKRKDQSLTAGVQYFNNNETENGDINESYFPPNTLGYVPVFQKSMNDQFESNFQGQADYYHPFQGKARLEAGFKLQMRQIDNNYEVSEKDSSGSYVNLERFTNHFNYDETIYAAYLLFGDDRGRFSYQFGLRSEYSDILTHLQETNEKSGNTFFDVFPSAHFTFKITETDHFQISYSRRIRRPEFMQLNPFHSYSDNRNIFTGNPELKPVYTDAFELGYIRYWEKANLNFNTYYRKSKDVFQRIESIDSTGITFVKPQNFAKNDSYGAELIGSFTGIKWLNLNGNLNFFRTITEGDIGERHYKADSYSWSGRANAKFNIAKGIDIQLTGNYQAAAKTPQGKRKPMWFTDLGASKDIIKGKGTLTLNVRDVFGSRRHAFESFDDNFYSRTEYKWGTTVVSLNFNYRINQAKKKNQDRQQGGEEGGMEF